MSIMFDFFGRNFDGKVDDIYLAVIVVLSVTLSLVSYPFAIPCILICIFVYMMRRRRLISSKCFLSGDADNVLRNLERMYHYSVEELGVGMAAFSKTGHLQYCNKKFREFTGQEHPVGKHLDAVFAEKNLSFENMCLKPGSVPLNIDGTYYELQYAGILTREHRLYGKKNKDGINGMMVYLFDVTETELLKQKYDNEKLCLAYVRFDNYDDVVRGMSESSMANLSGEVNEMIVKWVGNNNGFVCRMNKEICLVGFTKAAVMDIIEGKFAVLEKMKAIKTGNKLAPTLSIGLAADGDTLDELLQNAGKAMDNALNRGGDQAAVTMDGTTTYFGATGNVSVSRSRVRVRMVARTIREKMLTADRVFVMGHMREDFDAIGAAVGVARMGLSLKKETYIVVSSDDENMTLLNRILTESDLHTGDKEINYSEITLSEEMALPLVTSRSLLIMVDHHRESLVASRSIFEALPNRIVIDHHRRSDDIVSGGLVYLEPSSSSTAELVTELGMYFYDKMELSPKEATIMYAGIVLDTKNFTVQTGERTFEAAAILRSNGADINLVRELFKDERDVFLTKAKLLGDCRIPMEGLAFSVLKDAEKGTATNVVCASAADMLITLDGVCASVVMAEYSDGSLGISARSDGCVNVQLIMEALGGGGHRTVAGAQLEGTKAADIEKKIIELVKKQLEERDNNESNSVAGC